MTEKKNKSGIERLQKYEPLIAGIALFIGLSLLASYIILFVIKTNRDAEAFITKTSSAFYENTSIEEFFDYTPLEISVSSSGEEIVKEVELFEGVFLTADSMGTTVLVDNNSKLVTSAVFITDNGERITAYSKDDGVRFALEDGEADSFVLNGYLFEVVEEGMTVDGYQLVADSRAVPMTTTAETTTTTPLTTTEPETTTAEPTTTTTPQSEVSGEDSFTSPETTTTPKPTTTTTKKPATTTTTPTPTTTTTTTTTTTATTKKATTTTVYKTNDELVSQVLSLVNKERKKEGLEPLSGLIALDKAAQIRAGEITGADSNFSHTRPNGNLWYTVLNENHISYSAAGENLAAGQSTAEMVVSDWMASPDHRANILSPDFKYMGVGYVEYEGYLYWAQLFLK